jgi:hypothetical protein
MFPNARRKQQREEAEKRYQEAEQKRKEKYDNYEENIPSVTIGTDTFYERQIVHVRFTTEDGYDTRVGWVDKITDQGAYVKNVNGIVCVGFDFKGSNGGVALPLTINGKPVFLHEWDTQLIF